MCVSDLLSYSSIDITQCSPCHLGKLGPDELLVVGAEGAEPGERLAGVEELELLAVLGEALDVVPSVLRPVHPGPVGVVVLLRYARNALKEKSFLF